MTAGLCLVAAGVGLGALVLAAVVVSIVRPPQDRPGVRRDVRWVNGA